MLLNDVKTKLEKVDNRVFYGVVDKAVRETDWNYIVFNRTKLAKAKNNTGDSDYFDVHIVREDYVPDGMAEDVTAKMVEINGVRPTSEDAIYDYVQKPNTNIVVEMLTLHFVRARK